jgi:transposase-like protein
VESVLPLLYLHGLSSGDFREALPALLGPEAAGLSSSAILRLTKSWTAEYEAFRRRDLADRDYVYLWADGVHFTIRLEEERLCTLVVIGVRPDGTKEVVALEDGYRESAESWRTLLRDLKRRGLRAPVLAIGDGALGFWAAVRDVWPETAEQRCWVHYADLRIMPMPLDSSDGRRGSHWEGRHNHSASRKASMVSAGR